MADPCNMNPGVPKLNEDGWKEVKRNQGRRFNDRWDILKIGKGESKMLQQLTSSQTLKKVGA